MRMFTGFWAANHLSMRSVKDLRRSVPKFRRGAIIGPLWGLCECPKIFTTKTMVVLPHTRKVKLLPRSWLRSGGEALMRFCALGSEAVYRGGRIKLRL